MQCDKDLIKNDPEIGHRYLELLENLKRKKVMEVTYSEHYNESAYSQLNGKMFENEEDDLIEDEFKKFERKRITEGNYSSEKISTENLVATKEGKKVDNQIGKLKDKILASFETKKFTLSSPILNNSNALKVSKSLKILSIYS